MRPAHQVMRRGKAFYVPVHVVRTRGTRAFVRTGRAAQVTRLGQTVQFKAVSVLCYGKI